MSSPTSAVTGTRSLPRRTARSLLDTAGAVASWVQVTWLARRAHDRGVTVLDIDNTLADTWPSYHRTWPSEHDRLSSLPVLPGMKAAAHDAAVRRGDVIVFLSRRNWWHWPLTLRWLRRRGFSATLANLVLVTRPADKVSHLRRLTKSADSVTYWDDLSHGHEDGRATRYETVIREVLTLDLDYRDAEQIEAIVAAAGGR